MIRLSCDAFASPIGIACSWHLHAFRLHYLPASVAECGFSLCEASRYVVRIWDKRTAKSEDVRCACRSLFWRPLRER